MVTMTAGHLVSTWLPLGKGMSSPIGQFIHDKGAIEKVLKREENKCRKSKDSNQKTLEQFTTKFIKISNSHTNCDSVH